MSGAKLVNFLDLGTTFYFVIFMPLIAFMMVLVVPFYVFKLKGLSTFVRIILLGLIVATLIIVTIQFYFLNVNIDLVKQLYNFPSVWIFSWVIHVSIIVLIVAPLYWEEQPLFISLLTSMIAIIISANFIAYKFFTLTKVASKG